MNHRRSRLPQDAELTPELLANVRQRILARVDRGADISACWNWTLVLRNKYAALSVGNLKDYSHRWAYRAWNGPIPVAMQVCHRCDNPKCCNPAHLFVGSRKDNMRDAKAKGRLSTGERHARTISGERAPGAKLTWVAVRAIRYLNKNCGLAAPVLGPAFGVDPVNINFILRGHTWKEDLV